jgi:hypothetical protein
MRASGVLARRARRRHPRGQNSTMGSVVKLHLKGHDDCGSKSRDHDHADITMREFYNWRCVILGMGNSPWTSAAKSRVTVGATAAPR